MGHFSFKRVGGAYQYPFLIDFFESIPLFMYLWELFDIDFPSMFLYCKCFYFLIVLIELGVVL